jgi:hypothetical protein
VIKKAVRADGAKVATAGSLWAIASNNVNWILTPAEQRKLGGKLAIELEATRRLAKFNGFNPDLMDGRITSAPGDPDLLPQGRRVKVNVLGLTKAP